MDGPGISFSLFDNQTGNNTDRSPRAGAITPQEAIRVLSLHVPRVVGAFSPIPGGLLNASGGAGLGNPGAAGVPGNDLEELLRRLFGQTPSMPQPPTMPTPPTMPPQTPWPMGGAPSPGPMGETPSPGPTSAPPPLITPGETSRRLPDPGEDVYQPPTNEDQAPTGPTAPSVPREREPRDRRV